MTRRKSESIADYQARNREKARVWRTKNPGHSKQWRDANKEKHREHTRQFKLKNPDYHYEHTFGMARGQYAAMYKEQHGVCAICKQAETVMRRGKLAKLSVDHCHTFDSTGVNH